MSISVLSFLSVMRYFYNYQNIEFEVEMHFMANHSQPDIPSLAKAFKALSHPNRLQIYSEIMNRQAHQVETDDKTCLLGGCNLTEFIHSLNVGAPTISHHIKELVNAGLITVERNGKYMTCFPNESMREQLQSFFENLNAS